MEGASTSLPSRYGSAPARVVEGPAEQAVPDAVVLLGLRRVALITDPGLMATGVPTRVVQAVRDRGVDVVVWEADRGEPSESDVERCAEALLEQGIDGLVALGGGSVLDTAKGAGFLLANGGSMSAWWGFGKTPARHPPLIAVPTTAGTGSEVQSFALIGRDGDEAKMACGSPWAMPRVAILDGRIVASAPREVAVRAGLDALAHALETAVTTVRTDESRDVAMDAFVEIATSLPLAIEAGEEVEAHGSVLRAACRAGQAIEASMLGAVHATANALSTRYAVPHGLAVAVMCPHIVRLNAADPQTAATYAELATRWGVSPPNAEGLADALAGLLVRLGVPTELRAFGAVAEDVDLLAADAAGQWTAGFNPRPVDAALLAGVFRAAL